MGGPEDTAVVEFGSQEVGRDRVGLLRILEMLIPGDPGFINTGVFAESVGVVGDTWVCNSGLLG